MNCELILDVSVILGKTLHTREAAQKLLDVVANQSCDHVELDFFNVSYISRSFADQFYSEKLNLATTQQKSILVLNANEEVIRMLQTVARTQNKSDLQFNSMPVYKYSTWSQLESYLLSV